MALPYHLVSQVIQSGDNPNSPSMPVRLLFIHHSTGTNWLNDENGRLGIALKNNNYYVSDISYGWGPNGIGDRTDIGNWWEWFRDPVNSKNYTNLFYKENKQNSDGSYSRLSVNPDPSGENQIIMFKSCFPNSSLRGNPNDPVPEINSNPLRGKSSDSEYHTVANAKGIYIDLLEYFRLHQEKLFIIITAPPLLSLTYSVNARSFNMWLVNNWLQNYPYKNVFVFDFFNVLTTNGGNLNINDLNFENGNHHRWWKNAVQHKADVSSNVTVYSTTDEHPSQAGNLKATSEFLPLLNVAFNRWKNLNANSDDKFLKNISITCYPNPFAEKTTIKYQLLNNHLVRIVIYDMMGRRLHSFVNRIQNKGEYIIEFNGINLQSGIYNCLLEAGDERSNIMLIKLNN